MERGDTGAHCPSFSVTMAHTHAHHTVLAHEHESPVSTRRQLGGEVLSRRRLAGDTFLEFSLFLPLGGVSATTQTSIERERKE